MTILVDARESVRALRAVHARFYLATLPLALAVVGPGLIGATFLSQLEQQMQVGRPLESGACKMLRESRLGLVAAKRMGASPNCATVAGPTAELRRACYARHAVQLCLAPHLGDALSC